MKPIADRHAIKRCTLCNGVGTFNNPVLVVRVKVDGAWKRLGDRWHRSVITADGLRVCTGQHWAHLK